MPQIPAFVTNYEILRSQDYVLLTFATPTGEVDQGRMITQEVQKLALTHPRFLEFAAAVAQMAAVMQSANAQPAPAARRAPSPGVRSERRAIGADRDDGAASAEPANDSATGVVRH